MDSAGSPAYASRLRVQRTPRSDKDDHDPAGGKADSPEDLDWDGVVCN